MEFKSEEQRNLIAAVMERKRDVVAIIPTGGGKSAAFEVPAAVEEGFQTIVIVPFVSLLKDIMQRVQKYGIPVTQWDAKQDWPTLRKAKLVMVVYESAVAHRFAE